MKLKPTDEQDLILNGVRKHGGNIQIRSYAGTGKSSSLELISGILPPEPYLYVAFSKRVVEEAEDKRSKGEGLSGAAAIRTANGLGHRVWASTIPSMGKPDTKKSGQIFRDVIKELSKACQEEAWPEYWTVVSSVGMAKALGYIPNGKFPNAKRLIDAEGLYARLDERPTRLAQDLTDRVLTESIRAAYKGWIDYDDQKYMPGLFGGTFPKFSTILVDEQQDFSPIDYAMLDKLAKGRIIGVGDQFQSIFAFRGAVQSGMDLAQTRYNMEPYELTISFRCPQAVVEAARWRVPNFKWIKPGGRVERLTSLKMREFPDDCTIICRNNAPLFRLAFGLLGSGRGVRVIGSDIGPRILAILKKLGPEEMSRPQVISAIEKWRELKLEKDSKSANDTADCMAILAEHGDNLGQTCKYLEWIFSQQGTIQLTTGHKSKGLEWDTVYHLDPWLCGGDEQDMNLKYVITTRAKQSLYEIDSRSIEW